MELTIQVIITDQIADINVVLGMDAINQLRVQ